MHNSYASNYSAFLFVSKYKKIYSHAANTPRNEYLCPAKPYVNILMKYSFLIPVYNRPDEVDELLQSLAAQTTAGFEVIVVDDGSTTPCAEVVSKYADRLDVHSVEKPKSGPGQPRNYAAGRAQGDYLLILDSDVIVPPGYVEAVDSELRREPCDAFGGPDRAHPSFTPLQKAINYSMTSFFTTGGIRGGRKKMDRFYPRSFNMGVRREVYHALGGFSAMRFGEDIDFSIRIFGGGYRCRLFPEAWVLLLLGTLVCPYAPLPLLLYALLVCLDAAVQNRSLHIGVLAVAAAYVQLIGYGTGFWRAWWRRCVCGKEEFEAFKQTFYK